MPRSPGAALWTRAPHAVSSQGLQRGQAASETEVLALSAHTQPPRWCPKPRAGEPGPRFPSLPRPTARVPTGERCCRSGIPRPVALNTLPGVGVRPRPLGALCEPGSLGSSAQAPGGVTRHLSPGKGGRRGSHSARDTAALVLAPSSGPGHFGWGRGEWAGCSHLTGPDPMQGRSWGPSGDPGHGQCKCGWWASWMPCPHPTHRPQGLLPTQLPAWASTTSLPPKPGPSLLAPDNTPGRQPGIRPTRAHFRVLLLPASLTPQLHTLLTGISHLRGWPPLILLLCASPSYSFFLTLPFCSSSHPGGSLIAGVPGPSLTPPTTANPDGPRTEGCWAPRPSEHPCCGWVPF